MKNIFFFVLCLLGLVACESKGQQVNNEANGAPAGIYEDLDLAAFKEKMAVPGIVLLDVRTPAETADGKITNALEIDFRSEHFAEALDKLDKDKTYLVYCRSGARSANACEMMQEKGFKEVYNLLGGYTAWSK